MGVREESELSQLFNLYLFLYVPAALLLMAGCILFFNCKTLLLN